MKTIFKYFIIIFIGQLSLQGCNDTQVINTQNTNDDRYQSLIFNSKNGIAKTGNIFGETLINKDSDQKKVIFEVYQNNVDSILISMPSNWILKKEEGCLLYATLNTTPKGYFVLLRHNKKEYNLDLDTYFEYAVDEFNSDSVEVLVDLNSNNQRIKDYDIYLLEAKLKKDTVGFNIRSIYFEHGSFVYDLTIKYPLTTDVDFNPEIFNLMAQSLVIGSDTKPLFDPTLKSVKIRSGSK